MRFWIDKIWQPTPITKAQHLYSVHDNVLTF